ncbi:MAG: hypothetical protein KIT80_16135 [Chitinophagaceae bacterium]|nr:hypothetical protein [Chitinophagaceae bacterium]MCW5928446.1 hypothetical protein [Chitinophagaceae bacterium]
MSQITNATMSNNNQLPEELRKAINNFFFCNDGGENLDEVIDNITQDALHGIDQNGSEDAGPTFLFMRILKDLLIALKAYYNEPEK